MKQDPVVLIIDDDPIMGSIISRLVDNLGCQSIEAEDGEIALKILNGRAVNLVITDLVMPNVEGVEIILTVKRRLPTVPIIAISSGTSRGGADELLLAARNLGAAAVFKKPLPLESFADAIRSLLAAPNYQSS